MGGLNRIQNYAHGNPYYRVLRSEVKKFAVEIKGTTGVENQEAQHRLNGNHSSPLNFFKKYKKVRDK